MKEIMLPKQIEELVKDKPYTFFKGLYVFAYARKSPHFNRIKLYFDENKFKKPRVKAWRLRNKFKLRNFAKKIYRKIFK